jgi:polysaccharide export outer membrane protein
LALTRIFSAFLLAHQQLSNVKHGGMVENSKHKRHDRQLPCTNTDHRKSAFSMSSCLFSFIGFAALMFGGCETVQPPLPYPPGPKTAVRLSPGDTIKVTFAEESDLDQTEQIRRDGKVSLPLIGEVTAAGKRLMDFQREIISRYEGRLDNPEVLVTFDPGKASGTVFVSGFAHKPGSVAFDRPTTVYQAIMEAGGATDYGSLSNVHLTRIINGEQRTETINLKPTVRGKPTKPIYVQDGDVIYISRSWF